MNAHLMAQQALLLTQLATANQLVTSVLAFDTLQSQPLSIAKPFKD